MSRPFKRNICLILRRNRPWRRKITTGPKYLRPWRWMGNSRYEALILELTRPLRSS